MLGRYVGKYVGMYVGIRDNSICDKNIPMLVT